MTLTKLKVVFFHRKIREGQSFSVESIFKGVRERLPKDIVALVAVSKFESRGILKRVYNIIEACIKQINSDVNHITGDVHFLTFLLNKNKTVLTILDCDVSNRNGGLLRWLYKVIWYTIPVKRSRIITAISNSTKNDILKYVKCDPDKIVVIPVFISDKFKTYPKEFDKDRPVLLQIGTKKNKNVERLIEAIVGISCELEIVGPLSGDMARKLKEQGINYRNFVNLSEDELVERYNNCDIVIFVSTFEGFGMPIIEANAVGRPVITGNISSMPEVAGEAACLVDPFNINEIRDGIKRIIDDEKYRQSLIDKGFENAKRFDAQKITMQYYHLYKELNENIHIN